MGFVRGQKVTSMLNSPLNDPVKYGVMGYEVSLRRSEAAMIEVLPEDEANQPLPDGPEEAPNANDPTNRRPSADTQPAPRKNEINVALVGNPNSGKTSLFNVISGGREHVGNYSGVTVAAKTGHVTYKGYRFNITDLPGTYSLSAYSPEERYVRQHILDRRPDVILNVVVASNLERNLYLTTELIDLSQPTVIALNMYDELEASGATLNHEKLGGMIGIPMVPTVARTSEGIDTLLDTIIDLFEGRNRVTRQVNINYGTTIEPELAIVSRPMQQSDELPRQRHAGQPQMHGCHHAVRPRLTRHCAPPSPFSWPLPAWPYRNWLIRFSSTMADWVISILPPSSSSSVSAPGSMPRYCSPSRPAVMIFSEESFGKWKRESICMVTCAW